MTCTRRVDGDAAPLEERAVVLEGAPRELGEIEGPALQVDPAAGDAGHVEQALDEPGQVRGLSADDRHGPLALIAVGRGPVEDEEAVLDGGERVAQLVGEHGHEVVFARGRLLERLLAPVGALHLFPGARQLDVGGDAGEQLPRRERLDEVVVGARLEPLARGLFAGPGRDQDHGEGGERGVGPDLAEQAEAVEPGHHHVGQDQVRPPPPRRLQRGLPVDHGLDVKAAGEEPADVIAHVGVVVGEQHPEAPARG
jgi:hypothetical protein